MTFINRASELRFLNQATRLPGPSSSSCMAGAAKDRQDVILVHGLNVLFM